MKNYFSILFAFLSLWAAAHCVTEQIPCSNENCAACDDDFTFCKSCTESFAIIPFAGCVATGCPDTHRKGKFFETDACLPINGCHPSCKTCDAQGDPSHCLSCFTDYSFCDTLTDKKCCANAIDYCSDLTTPCPACHPDCKTCDGIQNTNCLSCQSAKPFLLPISKTCHENCPTGTYIYSAENKVCWYCHEDCLTCSGPNSNDCLTCGGAKPFLLQSKKTCLQQCQPLYREDSQSKQCIECHEDCLTCDGLNSNNCLSCAPGSSKAWLAIGLKTCNSACPLKTFQLDLELKTCGSCHSDCLTCENDSSAACLSCAPPKEWYFAQQKTCDAACPLSSFISNAQDKICSACHPSCLTCDGAGASQCLSCPASTTPWFTSSKKTCTSVCPPGTFVIDSDKKLCQQCDPSCATCDGGSVTGCLTCSSSHEWYYAQVKSCHAACPLSTFISDSLKKICSACHPSCLTCDGAGANQCLSCPASTTPWFTSSKKTCTSVCPPGTFVLDSGKKLCQQCDPSCATCDDGSLSGCLSCSAPSNWYFAEQKTCHAVCPPSTFVSDSQIKICSACHPTCLTCDGAGGNQCLSCPVSTTPWFTPWKKTCSANCLPGTFVSDSEKKICDICHPSCETCSKSTENDCLSCKNTALAWLFQGKCYPLCPLTTYIKSEVPPVCEKCPTHCLTCVGLSACITCEDDYFLNKSKLCSICDKNCATCAGPLASDCLSCKPATYLSNYTCVTACPPGFFNDDKILRCSSCNPACSECKEKDVCTKCPAGAYLTKENKCELCDKNCLTCSSLSVCTTCPDGYALNKTTSRCSPCTPKCATCQGLSESDCQSCTSGSFLSGSKCLSECLEGFYNDSRKNTCEKCNATCKACSGPQGSQCLSCSPGLLLLKNSSCVAECPDDFYENTTTFDCLPRRRIGIGAKFGELKTIVDITFVNARPEELVDYFALVKKNFSVSITGMNESDYQAALELSPNKSDLWKLVLKFTAVDNLTNKSLAISFPARAVQSKSEPFLFPNNTRLVLPFGGANNSKEKEPRRKVDFLIAFSSEPVVPILQFNDAFLSLFENLNYTLSLRTQNTGAPMNFTMQKYPDDNSFSLDIGDTIPEDEDFLSVKIQISEYIAELDNCESGNVTKLIDLEFLRTRTMDSILNKIETATYVFSVSVSNVFSTGTPSAIGSSLSMNNVKYLKILNFKAQEEKETLKKGRLLQGKLVRVFEDKDNLPQIWRNAGISPYFFQNFKEGRILFSLIVIFISLVLYFVCERVLKLKHTRKAESRLAKAFWFLYECLVWNFTILAMFIIVQQLWIFLAISFYTYSAGSSEKDANLGTSLGFILPILLLYYIHIWLVCYALANDPPEFLSRNRRIAPTETVDKEGIKDTNSDCGINSRGRSSIISKIANTPKKKKARFDKEKIEIEDRAAFSSSEGDGLSTPEKAPDYQDQDVLVHNENSASDVDAAQQQSLAGEPAKENGVQIGNDSQTSFCKCGRIALLKLVLLFYAVYFPENREAFTRKHVILIFNLRMIKTFSKYYVPIIVTKQLIISTILILLYEHIIVQLVITLVITFFSILAHLIHRPMHSKVLWILTLTSEILFFVCLCLTIKFFLQGEDELGGDSRKNFLITVFVINQIYCLTMITSLFVKKRIFRKNN